MAGGKSNGPLLAVFFSMSLLLPLQFQSVFGRTAMEAGLLVIPPILVMTAARASSTAS